MLTDIKYKIKTLGMIPVYYNAEQYVLVTNFRRIHRSNNPSVNEWVHNELRWVKVSDVKIGDYLLIPRMKRSKNDVFIRMRIGRKKVNSYGDRREYKKILINEDIAFLLGVYTAEGCLSNNGRTNRIIFNLGSHEIDLINKIRNILIKLGFKGSKSIKKSMCLL